jgi:cytochrome c
MSNSCVVKLAIACGASLALLSGTALAEGDIAAGEKVFQRCLSCHNVADTTNKMGPHLNGVVGRPVASVEGFAYSEAFKAFGATGAVWDEATLDKFLKEPILFVKDTKMMAAPVRRDSERADLIAFLKSNM